MTPSADAGQRVGGILLAAGASTRLGQPKALVHHAGRPLVRHVAEVALRAPLAELVVVLGSDAEAVRAALAGLPVRIELAADWREGMAASLRTGLEALEVSDLDAALVLLVDQPGVSTVLLGSLCEAWRASGQIVACRWNETLGPPALFPRAEWPALRALRGDTGARGILRARPDSIRTVPFPDGDWDVDVPEDLARLGRAD